MPDRFVRGARRAAGARGRTRAACDRECLRGKITEVLYALVEHDASKLAVAGNLRVTEDGVEKPLAQVGLVRSVTRLRGYRQDIIDERAGQAVAGVMVEEAGAPIILAVRVKVDGEQKLSELELVATRSRADGLLFNIDGYSGAPPRAMNFVPRPDQLETRERGDRDRDALPARAQQREDLQRDRHAVRARRPIASRTAR